MKKILQIREFIFVALLGVGLNLPLGAVTIPNTFTGGSALSATQMNNNFTAVKTAVDTLEGKGQWDKATNDISYAAGKVSIGSTSFPGIFNIMNNGATPDINFETYSTTARTLLQLRRGRGTSAGPSLVQNGDELGRLYFQGYDGGAFSNGAAVGATVDATPGASDMPASLVFYTSPDGSNSITERMRITNTGRVGIGTTGPGALLEASDANNPVLKLTKTGAGAGSIDLIQDGSQPRIFGPSGLSLYMGVTGDAVGSGLTLKPGGNIGVGNSNPQTKLHVGSGAMFNSTNADNFILSTFTNTPNPNFTIGMGNGAGGISTNWLSGNSSGHVGIGTASPITRLHVSGSIAKTTVAYSHTAFIGTNDASNPLGLSVYARGDGTGTVRYVDLQSEEYGATTYRTLVLNGNGGNVGIGQPNPTEKLHVAGNILATGTITPSDLKFKRDVRPLTPTLPPHAGEGSKISYSPLPQAWGKGAGGIGDIWQPFLSLSPSTYYWRKNEFKDKNFDDVLQYGFIAQNVEKSYPALVKTSSDGFKSLNYSGIIAINTAAIQQLKREKDAENAQLQLRLVSLSNQSQQAERRAQVAEARAAKLEQKLAQLEKSQEQRLAALEARLNPVARR